MSRILVGIDGSDSSVRAAQFAAERAKALGAELVVACVIPWSPYSFHTPEENAARHSEKEKEIGKARAHIIDPIVAQLDGITPHVIIQHGQPVEKLLQLIHDQEPNHVVIGRRGEGKLKAMLFGSVVAGLVQASTVPVTVIP